MSPPKSSQRYFSHLTWLVAFNSSKGAEKITCIRFVARHTSSKHHRELCPWFWSRYLLIAGCECCCEFGGAQRLRFVFYDTAWFNSSPTKIFRFIKCHICARCIEYIEGYRCMCISVSVWLCSRCVDRVGLITYRMKFEHVAGGVRIIWFIAE